MKHPADRIRSASILALVGLGFVARDLLRIYRWAGDARASDREIRREHAATLNDLDEAHLQRVRTMQETIDDMAAKLNGARERLVVVEDEPEPGEA